MSGGGIMVVTEKLYWLAQTGAMAMPRVRLTTTSLQNDAQTGNFLDES